MIASNNSITVTARNLANLRIARLKAIDANRHLFVFEGNALDVRFAAHLIDYLATLLNEKAAASADSEN